MRKMFVFRCLASIIMSWLLLVSCSSRKSDLQFIFPLGITYDKVMQDEQISSKKAKASYGTEEELSEYLSDIYTPDKDRIYETYEEDNFNLEIDLNNITALSVMDYIKEGITYRLNLIFRDGKLIQVAGMAKDDDDISLLNAKILSLGDPIHKIYKHTYYNSRISSSDDTFKTRVIVFKAGKIHLESQYEDMDDSGFTYYSEKIVPLQEIL